MSERGLFDELFSALEKNPAPRWIFGERLTIGGHEAVPVSEFRVAIDLPRRPAGDEPAPEPAASLRLDGRPIGFLTASEGRLVFVPIAPEPGPAPEGDDVPGWVDDLFRKLDDVRDSVSGRGRDDDEDDDERGGDRRDRRDRCGCRSRRDRGARD